MSERDESAGEDTLRPDDPSHEVDVNEDESTPQLPSLEASDLETNILMGVCGVSQSGKTVFLASIFHCVNGTHVEGVGRITLDRKNKGGERYFRIVEETIRETGQSEPTRESAVARLLVDPDGPAGLGSQRGLILFDFAGGHFTAFADIDAAKRNADTERERNELRQVENYLEKCDALLLLIDSSDFRKGPRPAQSDPFSASVVSIRDYCASTNKPMAMVFSKADLNRSLTIEQVREFGRVKQFDTLFEKDPTREDRPFGLVELLSCYEVDPDYGGVRQAADGSIWRPEPRNVFVQMLQAAWPRARARMRQTIDARAAERRLEEDTELWKRRRKVLTRIALAAALAGALAAPFVWRSLEQRNQTASDVDALEQAAVFLQEGAPQRVGPRHLAAIQRVQETGGNDRTRPSLRALEDAYEASLQVLPAAVYSDEAETRATESLLTLADLLSPADRSPLELLRAHKELRNALVNPEVTLEERIELSERMPQLLADVDGAFADFLVARTSELRKSAADEMIAAGYNLSTLAGRLNYVRTRLSDDRRNEREELWQTALQQAYAQLIGSALGGLGDRDDVVDFLEEANPAFKALLTSSTGDYVELVRYGFILDAIGEVEPTDVSELHTRVQTSLEALTSRDDETQFLLADTMEELFRRAGSSNRKGLWLSLFEGVDSEYLFSLRRDTWPPGKGPWKTSLLGSLAAANYSWDTTLQSIEEISARPLYWWEVGALATDIGDRHLGLETVRFFEQAWQQVAGDGRISYPRAAANISQIATLSSTLNENRSNFFGVESGSLQQSQLRAEGLARALMDVDDTRGLSSREGRRLLQRYCQSEVRQYDFDCPE